jgi:hypothetical protein
MFNKEIIEKFKQKKIYYVFSKTNVTEIYLGMYELFSY